MSVHSLVYALYQYSECRSVLKTTQKHISMVLNLHLVPGANLSKTKNIWSDAMKDWAGRKAGGKVGKGERGRKKEGRN